jgi:outer membrane immunogenic protein
VKKLLLATTIISGLTTAAFAADLPSRYAPAPAFAPVPTFTWTGFYVGAQIGYGWENADDVFVPNTPVALGGGYTAIFSGTSNSAEGVLGGAHVGYNMQMGNVVFGVEGDIEATNVETDATATVTAFGPGLGAAGTTATAQAKAQVNWAGSIRGRLGFAFDRVLIYGTGGVAVADVEESVSLTVPAFPALNAAASASDNVWGWTLGGGLEYAFTNNLTARAEYRYTRLDGLDERPSFSNDGDDPHLHVVRVGASYKF